MGKKLGIRPKLKAAKRDLNPVLEQMYGDPNHKHGCFSGNGHSFRPVTIYSKEMILCKHCGMRWEAVYGDTHGDKA